MRKLRLLWALPIAFVGLSAIELIWANRLDTLLLPLHPYIAGVKYLWYALNAPALFFFAIVIHYAPVRAPHNLAKLLTDDVLFLTGGVILWFVIGSILDSRNQTIHPKVPTKTLRVAQAFVILWGIYLCWQGMHMVSSTDYLGRHLPGNLLNGIIVILWSLVLITVPGASLMRSARSPAKPLQPRPDLPGE